MPVASDNVGKADNVEEVRRERGERESNSLEFRHAQSGKADTLHC